MRPKRYTMEIVDHPSKAEAVVVRARLNRGKNKGKFVALAASRDNQKTIEIAVREVDKKARKETT